MNITEVKIIIASEDIGVNEHIRAFASVVLNGEICIRDMKILQASKGLFVAMPSRKLLDRCHFCLTKNHLRARFCNQCGGRLNEHRAEVDEEGRAKLHADVCHPISRAARVEIEQAVLDGYEVALREHLAVAVAERGAA